MNCQAPVKFDQYQGSLGKTRCPIVSCQHCCSSTNLGKAQGSNPSSGLNGNNAESKEGFKSSDPFHWDFSESFGGPLFKMKISGRVMGGRKRGSSSSVDTFLIYLHCAREWEVKQKILRSKTRLRDWNRKFSVVSEKAWRQIKYALHLSQALVVD